MKFENTEVYNFQGAIRGARNPMASWNKGDSTFNVPPLNKTILGQNDLGLMQRLIKASVHDGNSSHDKFMRQIMVCVDITAPLYWWKEFDTYKVGTVANSTSTMHKLTSTPITLECFELGTLNDGEMKLDNYGCLKFAYSQVIDLCESIRQEYLRTKDKKWWKALIRLLPESWLQTRTVTMSYENIRNMYFQRKNHKLTEWSVDFIGWVESLPYAEELIMYKG